MISTISVSLYIICRNFEFRLIAGIDHIVHLMLDIVELKTYSQERHAMLDALGCLTKHKSVVEAIVSRKRTGIILDNLSPKTCEIEIIEAALKIVRNSVSFNQALDSQLLENGLLKKLEILLKEKKLLGYENGLMNIAIISVNLLSSGALIADQFRNSELKVFLMELLHESPSEKVMLKLLICS